jgi:hypothetical protein
MRKIITSLLEVVGLALMAGGIGSQVPWLGVTFAGAALVAVGYTQG